MTAPGGVLDGLDPALRGELRAIAEGVALDAELARLEQAVSARRVELAGLLAERAYRMAVVPVPDVLEELAAPVLRWCVDDLELARPPTLSWFVPVRADERFDFAHGRPVDGLAWRDQQRIAVRVGLSRARLVEVLAHEARHCAQPAGMRADEAEADALAYGIRVRVFEADRLLGGGSW